MKNISIIVLLAVTVALGVLCLNRQKQMTQIQAELASLQSHLANLSAAGEDAAANAGRKTKVPRDGSARPSKTTGDREEPARTLATAKANGGNPLAAMMKDPKTRELMLSQQKAMFGPLIEKRYAGFFEALNLAPDQAGALKDLLQKKMLAGAEAKMSMLGGGVDAAQRPDLMKRITSEKEACDTEIRQFLGDENYQSFQEYEKTGSSRTTVAQFSDQLTGGATPLDADQQQQLIQAMSGGRSSFPWSSDANQQINHQGPANGDPTTRFTEDQINLSAQEREQFDRQFLGRARQVLTPEQATAFEKFQATQREMLIHSMKLAAKMVSPNGP